MVTFRKEMPCIPVMSSLSSLIIQHITGDLSVPGASPPIFFSRLAGMTHTCYSGLSLFNSGFQNKVKYLLFLLTGCCSKCLTAVKVFCNTFECSYFTISSYLNPGEKQTEELPK